MVLRTALAQAALRGLLTAMCALALSAFVAAGCGENAGEGASGSGGEGGIAGNSGTRGMGGDAGSGGVGGGTSCPETDCNDANPCTEDLCDLADGTCSNPAFTDGTICFADENPGRCVAGECTGLCEFVDCDDGNDCTDDRCDPDHGSCFNPPLSDGTTCDAGGDPGQCSAGLCLGLCADVDCDDGKECTEDLCDNADGSCEHPNRPEGSDCDFGGLPGRCEAGTCVDAELCREVDCNDGNDCTEDVCDPANANCSNPNKVDGAFCQTGGNPGLCRAGVCQGLCERVSCDDGNQCTVDMCDPVNASCPNPDKTDGAPCDYGDDPGRCSAGLCVGLCTGIVCNDHNQCTSDACDPLTGSCTHTDREDGTSCDFGGIAGVCEAGECVVCPTGAVNTWFAEEKTQYCDYDGPLDAYYVPIPCLWAEICVPGIGWSTAAELACEIPSCGRFATRLTDILTAADSAGNAFVAWTEIEYWSDGGEYMSARRFTPAGGWEERVFLGEPYFIYRTTDFAMDGDGNAIAVIATNTGIVANRYAVGEGWEAQEVLATVRPDIGQEVRLTMEEGGTAFASWRTAQGSVASRYLPAEGWGEPELIGGDAIQLPEIEIYPNGNATAVWVDYDGVTWSNQYVVGIGWGAPELVD